MLADIGSQANAHGPKHDFRAGNRELAAVLVAINSIIQIIAYSLLGYFYLTLLNENYAGHIRELAKAHGVRLTIEA